MPYPEVIQVICPQCKTEILVYTENGEEEHICRKCSCVLMPERMTIPDPRHIC